MACRVRCFFRSRSPTFELPAAIVTSSLLRGGGGGDRPPPHIVPRATCYELSSCLMYLGVNGTRRGCLPVASKIAFAIAAGTKPFGPSPAPPIEPTLGLLTISTSISGSSAIRRIGKLTQSRLVIVLLLKVTPSCSDS